MVLEAMMWMLGVPVVRGVLLAFEKSKYHRK
jgi:hypothetical protein